MHRSFLRHLFEYFCVAPIARAAVSRWDESVFLSPLCQTNLALLSAHSVCHYSRLFWEWGEGVKVHDSQKRQDPEKLSKETVLSFIQAHHP